ncbi:MAG: ABC transporter ATP-binding protein, partial [Prevotellaceae bacterium]|nr:ABC transporter ATP-binding protein [Candidatus Faecinaster equi]
SSEYVWALRDINFNVEQGDVVGIIGKNGAGKSTLLKLLSRVTGPTTGQIRAHGRIGSLLEVGTGFHQEMTGRENIFMNGAILGMTRAEIQSKLDEIVDFSGCERYIDTPVKRYSSGMMVRLGFAVAAHLDPEILVVDEVLAVGDAEFQKKAIGKMQDVSQGQGRTVLFVSHNMASVARLCNIGIVLEHGQTAYQGKVREAIDYYLSSGSIKSATYIAIKEKNIQILSASILNDKGEYTNQFTTNQDVEIVIKTKNNGNRPVRCNFSISNQMDMGLIVDRFEVQEGEHKFSIRFNTKHLLMGTYRISFALDVFGMAVYDIASNVLSFDIVDLGTQYSVHNDKDNGLVSSFVKVLEI